MGLFVCIFYIMEIMTSPFCCCADLLCREFLLAIFSVGKKGDLTTL